MIRAALILCFLAMGLSLSACGADGDPIRPTTEADA